MSKKEMVTLENLGGGAASEMFSDSLEKVIENIINPNTKPVAEWSALNQCCEAQFFNHNQG